MEHRASNLQTAPPREFIDASTNAMPDVELEEDASDDESVSVIDEVPTFQETIKALDLIENYLKDIDDGLVHVQKLDVIRDYLFKEKKKRATQTSITDFFTSG